MEDYFEFPTSSGAVEEDMDMEMVNDDDVVDEIQVLKVGEEKEIAKTGMKKKLIVEGEGWEKPSIADEVEVHYVGTVLDGTQFDLSWDRGTPFKFKLGQGQVIKEGDEGIKTMKKGEKTLFTIPSDMAYGESGSPPTIPPNATLQFELHVLQFQGYVRSLRSYGSQTCSEEVEVI